jgi:hypothetical protein
LELSTNFEGNGVGALGVPSGLTRSFEIAVDTVVVRSRVLAQVVDGVNSNAVFRSRVTNSGVVTANLSRQITQRDLLYNLFVMLTLPSKTL